MVKNGAAVGGASNGYSESGSGPKKGQKSKGPIGAAVVVISCKKDKDVDGAKDGMGDMLFKILHQSIPGNNPVLAKRKTTIMREMEESKDDRDRLKRQRVQRKTEREQQLVVPDATTADYESQLRKLAIRGVVSLFNAISAAKREEAEANTDTTSSARASAEASEAVTANFIDVKRMSQENYLELLKDGDGGGKTSNTTFAAGMPSSAPPAPPVSNTSWSALRDDYLLENEMTLKNWDKDGDDEDLDEEDQDLDVGRLRVDKKK